MANTNVSTCTTLDTANTFYDLTTNLTTTTVCMGVTAANITFDCKGYSITGDGGTVDTGIGIGQTVALNFTAKNCIINSFGTGIKTISANNVFMNNTINKTSGTSSAAIYIQDSTAPQIINNTIDNCNGSAILLDNGDSAIVSGNTILNHAAAASADPAIYISGTSNVQIISNIVTNSLKGAIYFADNGGGTAEVYANNTLTNITGYAFYFYPSIQAKTIANNTVLNATSGFISFGSYGVTATRSITNNTYDRVNANITFTINPTYSDIFYWYPTPTSLPTDPALFQNISKYFNTTVTGTGGTPKISINATYSDANIVNVEESSLQLYHWNGTTWSNSTLGATQNAVYAANNYVATANITNFSLFSIIGVYDDSPPIVSSRISPSPAYVNSTLLGYCNATDNENATLRYYYRWFLNGAVNATGTSANGTNATELNVANITSGLVKAQNWSLECIANDFIYNSTALNSSVLTISNSPPTIASQLSFINSSTDHSFTATAGITDIDGASDMQSTNASSTIGTCAYFSNSTSGNDFNATYNCTATYAGTSSVRLGFTDKGSAYIGTNLATNAYPDRLPTLGAPTLSPIPAYKNTSAITCNAGSWSDPDGDTENTTARSWKWYRNATTISGQVAQTLANTTFNKTDIIICEETATANNWTASTMATNSSQLTISNSLPEMATPTLSPTTAYKNTSSISCVNGSSNDSDGDTISFYYLWYLNGTTTGITTSAITNATYNKTDVLICQITPYDGTANGTAKNSTGLTVSNTIPVTDAPTLSPIPAYKNTSMITCANGTTNDADNDTVTFTYLWYLNGTTTGITDQNITNTSYDITDELICQITPNDGTVSGTAKNSTVLTISGYSNTPSTINNSRIYPTPTASHNSILNGYCNASDAESATITYYWNWYLNGALYGAGSVSAPNATETNVENIPASVTTPGQNWTLECMGNDGTANGTASNSTATEVVGFKNLAGGIIQNGNATYNLPIKWMVSQSVDEDGVCQYIIPAAYWANFSANTIVLFNNTGGNLGADPNNRTVEWNCTVSAQPYNLTFNITANTLSFSNSSWSQNTTAENNVTRQHIYYNVTAVNSGAFSITNADFPTACFDANTTCTIQNTTNLTALQTLIVRQYGYGDYISETEAPQTITQDASMQPFIYAANTTLYLNSTLISNNTINLSLNGVTWNFSYVNLTCYDSAQCNFMQNYTAMENKSKPLQVSTNLTITESTETIPTNPFLYGDGIWTNISDDLNLTISNIKFARVVPAAPYFAFFVCAGGTCTASDGTGWASETASVVSGEIRRDAGDSLSSIMFLIPFSSSAGGGGGTITPPGNETPDLCGEQQYVTCGASQLSCTCYAGVWSCPTCYVENTTLIYGGGGGVIIPGTGLTGFVENLTGNAVVATTFTCGLLIGDDFPSIPIQVRAFVNQARCEFDSLLQMRIDSIKLPLGALMFVVLLLLTLYYSNKPTARAKFLLLGALTILEGVYSIELIVGYASIFL